MIPEMTSKGIGKNNTEKKMKHKAHCLQVSTGDNVKSVSLGNSQHSKQCYSILGTKEAEEFI